MAGSKAHDIYNSRNYNGVLNTNDIPEGTEDLQ